MGVISDIMEVTLFYYKGEGVDYMLRKVLLTSKVFGKVADIKNKSGEIQSIRRDRTINGKGGWEYDPCRCIFADPEFV